MTNETTSTTDRTSILGFIFLILIVLPFLYILLSPSDESYEDEWETLRRQDAELSRRRRRAREQGERNPLLPRKILIPGRRPLVPRPGRYVDSYTPYEIPARTDWGLVTERYVDTHAPIEPPSRSNVYRGAFHSKDLCVPMPTIPEEEEEEEEECEPQPKLIAKETSGDSMV